MVRREHDVGGGVGVVDEARWLELGVGVGLLGDRGASMVLKVLFVGLFVRRSVLGHALEALPLERGGITLAGEAPFLALQTARFRLVALAAASLARDAAGAALFRLSHGEGAESGLTDVVQLCSS